MSDNVYSTMINTYEEAIAYLYNAFPMFQKEGAKAYKPGLETITKMLEAIGNPHKQVPCIHVAGTNGKGSCSSMLASVFFAAKLRVGLFTSPHLLDFRERIRIDGVMVDEAFVVSFCNTIRAICQEEGLQPSFFEITTAMAFSYFAQEQVDLAVIEVGMGGRLDSTNVITPLVSVITNISLDHTAYLGSTLKAIAEEKCGIIKTGIPVLIGSPENEILVETASMFAKEKDAALILCNRDAVISSYKRRDDGTYDVNTVDDQLVHLPLRVDYQLDNLCTVLSTIKVLQQFYHQRFASLGAKAVQEGIEHTQHMGLRGRMQKLFDNPETFIDTGHNLGAWEVLGSYLNEIASHRPLLIVMGMASDKDFRAVFHHLPKSAKYFFTCSSGARGLSTDKLLDEARKHELQTAAYKDVGHAYQAAYEQAESLSNPCILVCGSNFIVGDFLSYLSAHDIHTFK